MKNQKKANMLINPDQIKADYTTMIESKSHKKREEFVRSTFMSDDFLLFIEKNTAPFEELLSFYRCALMEVETKFRVLNEQFSLKYDNNPIESIKTRLKSKDSLIRKIRDKKVPLDLDTISEQITDIAGVRIICSFQEDIYKLAENFVHQDDITLLETKDYIKNPKPSGYRSLHLIVQIPIFLEHEKRNMKVEVQFRTIAMDFWASLEHKLRYKKKISPKMQEELANKLSACAESISKLDEEMQEIKNGLHSS